MTQNTSIEVDGVEIFRGKDHFDIAAEFDAGAQSRILNETGLALRFMIDPSIFWLKTADACRQYAVLSRFDKLRPTASDYQRAIDATTRMQAALEPLLEEDASELLVTLYTHAHQLVASIQRCRLNEPNPMRSRRQAPGLFISVIGGLFTDGFGRSPGETLDGPFARFVIACLAETKGIAEPPSYEWVQKWTRTKRKSGFLVGRLLPK